MTQGTAYAFFDCKASLEAVEAEIEDIRRGNYGVPSELELTVNNGVQGVTDERILNWLSDPSLGEYDLNGTYNIRATYRGHTNQETAKELSHVMFNLSESKLYKKSKDMVGNIAYRDRDRLVIE